MAELTSMSQRGGHFVLRAVDIASSPAHAGAQRRQRFDQHRCLCVDVRATHYLLTEDI